jgi:hypothetical protein
MNLWYELEAIALNISYSNMTDALICQYYENKGVYSTSSLYFVINFGGVQLIFIPDVLQLHIPPRVYIFIWLLSHNKLMTRDNLKKDT